MVIEVAYKHAKEDRAPYGSREQTMLDQSLRKETVQTKRTRTRNLLSRFLLETLYQGSWT